MRKTDAGIYTKQLSGEAEYESFTPTSLQSLGLLSLDPLTANLLAQANRSLGELNGIASQIPNIDLFVSMYVRKEALLSSQIEGTQATLEDIFDPEADTSTNLNVEEVINYVQATNFAFKRLEELPISGRLLKETHEILLAGVRGGERYPGEFRKSQNWIGAPGSSLSTASFVPPAPEDMLNAMSELERYIHNRDANDPLVRIALVHYQFETIHPFLDGNGRLGRLLITMLLQQEKILTKPVLYLSYFLKLNRSEYYRQLSQVRSTGRYDRWIAFFLDALVIAAVEAIDTTKKIIDLRTANLAKLEAIEGAQGRSVRLIYAYLERSPIINVKKTAEKTGVSPDTVARVIKQLIDLEILVPTSDRKRNRTFSYAAYLDILRKGTE